MDFQCLSLKRKRKPTERLDRGTAVNRCRAMAGIKPLPFKLDDPPSIFQATQTINLKKSSSAKRDSCSNRRRVDSTKSPFRRFSPFFRRLFSAGRGVQRRCGSAQAPGTHYKQRVTLRREGKALGWIYDECIIGCIMFLVEMLLQPTMVWWYVNISSKVLSPNAVQSGRLVSVLEIYIQGSRE